MTAPRTILVTGATGRIGRLVVDELLRGGMRVRALTRQPERAALPEGAEIVRGDFTAPASLDVALEGVDAVFLVWVAPIEHAAAAVARLTAPSSEGPHRLVYLSAPHQTPHPFFQQPNPLRAVHVEVERLLADATSNCVVLRPGMFASNALHWWAPQIRVGDVVRWPYGAAETAPIDERDVAAVAARALFETTLTGRDYVLTGPASLSQADQVRAIGTAIGRQLRFEELTPEEFRRDAVGTWPPHIAEMLLSAWRAMLGHRAFVTSTVEEITGSPARSVQQWAADNVPAFHRQGDGT